MRMHLLLLALAAAIAVWVWLRWRQGGPRPLPRNRARHLRIRLHLRRRPGPGFASGLELWLRWGRFAAFRQSRRARPSLSAWRRMRHPGEHCVLLGRAHHFRRVRLPVEEHALILAPPRTGKTDQIRLLEPARLLPVDPPGVVAGPGQPSPGLGVGQRGPVGGLQHLLELPLPAIPPRRPLLVTGLAAPAGVLPDRGMQHRDRLGKRHRHIGIRRRLPGPRCV